jgi:hypothetical protein
VAVLLADEARRRLDGGDPGSARLLADRALERARQLDRPEEIGPAAQLLAECMYVVGDVGAAWPLAEEALRVDEARGDAAATGMDLNLLGVLQITLGQLDDALATLRRSYDLRLEALGEDTRTRSRASTTSAWRCSGPAMPTRRSARTPTRCAVASGLWARATAGPPRP